MNTGKILNEVAEVRQTVSRLLLSVAMAFVVSNVPSAVSAQPSKKDANPVSNKITISAQKEPDLGPVEAITKNLVRMHIATILNDSTTPTSLRPEASVTFSLDTSGKAVMIRMTKSTGDPSTDQRLIESLRRYKFPQLPPECSPKEFTFPLMATLEKSSPLVQQQLRKAGIEIRTVLGKFDKIRR